ncbi:LRR domain containing protein [Parasponia andersonii]|uniref:LRR domain containing protein n=1 Tax=Parasponia andersonii TaxID=3476 RepID=A0A2P5B7A5_PARAD|nr:LRR domain containing protein [Parasponia andersonii]
MRNDEMALDGLLPPQNLKALIVQNYMGVRFGNWLSSLTNLVELELINCKCCQSLPTLHHLSYLKKLTFRALPALEYVSDRDWDLSSTSSTMSKLMSLFQSLEELTISNCDNLKGWWPGKGGGTNKNGEVMVSIVEHQHQISFPKHLVLYINNCPNLTSMPLFPNHESLRLYGTSSEPLQQTINVAATSTSSFSAIHSSCCFSPLSKLKFLILLDVQDIEFLLMVIGNLSSLESLKIELCLNLALLPDGIGDLSSLVSLVIQDCSYLVSISEEIGNLLSLETLTFWGYPNLETLPEGLCNLISLQSLTVLECHNLTSLPKGICNLPFLKFVNGQDWMCISTFAETGQTQDYITTSASTGSFIYCLL